MDDKYNAAKQTFVDAFKDLTEESNALCDALRVRDLQLLKILDTAPEPDYDDLAKLAAIVTSAEAGFVTFIDDTRTWIKSTYCGGQYQTSNPRADTICNLTIQGAAPFVVPNTATDPRTKDIRFVKSGEVGSYVGIPILSPSGTAVGTVCAVTSQAYEITQKHIDNLHIVARLITSLLAKRVG